MLQFQSTPSSFNFAENPILYKLILSGGESHSFQQIRLDATFTFQVTGGTVERPSVTTRTFTTQFSAPAQIDHAVSFNLSDAAQTLFKQYAALLSPADTSKTARGIVQTLHVVAHEVYFDAGIEVVTQDTTTADVHIVPGGESEYRRYMGTGIALNALARLSTKPSHEILYKGQAAVLPLFSTAKVDQGEIVLQYAGGIKSTLFYDLEPGSTSIMADILDNPRIPDNSPLTITYAPGQPPVTAVVRKADAQTYHFRFLNRFGMLESISVQSLTALNYQMETDSFNMVQPTASATPSPHRYLRKTPPAASLSLSSGYVSAEWANWFISEFLTTPRAWMLVNGQWLPGVVEPDDKLIVYDRTKPELTHVEFTFTAAVDGVIDSH